MNKYIQYTTLNRADRNYSLIRKPIQLLSALLLMDLVRGLIMKSELTQARLKELLNYNPETGIFTRRIGVCNQITGDVAGWEEAPGGYIQIGINYKTFKAHRLAWLYMKGYLPKNIDVEHIDRIKDNNRWENLRLASRMCNMRNTSNRSTNTSGVKGVSWNKLNKKWVAQITVNKINKGLGLYQDFDSAVCARLAGEQCLNWSHCDSNSPAYRYVKNNIQTINGG